MSIAVLASVAYTACGFAVGGAGHGWGTGASAALGTCVFLGVGLNNLLRSAPSRWLALAIGLVLLVVAVAASVSTYTEESRSFLLAWHRAAPFVVLVVAAPAVLVAISVSAFLRPAASGSLREVPTPFRFAVLTQVLPSLTVAAVASVMSGLPAWLLVLSIALPFLLNAFIPLAEQRVAAVREGG